MIILIFLIIILIIPYVIDIFVYGKSLYKRFKIGRWNNVDEWENAIVNVAEKWIKKSPVVKKTDNSHFLLFDMVKGNYKNNTIQSWQTGLVYLALVERNNHAYLNEFIYEDGSWKKTPQEVDFSLLSYAILKDSVDKKKIRKAMDEMYNLILSRICENDGCVCYRKYCMKERFVDTIGFIAPFLSYYGKIYHCDEAKNLAKKVVEEYYLKGFHSQSQLPVHAYDSDTCIPLGIYGWGRGTGWYLLGIIETYNILKDDKLKRIIKNLANKYLEYQKHDGSYSSIIQLQNGSDSSVTAIIAYFYACSAIIFDNSIYLKASKKAISYLMSVTRRNGEIDFSQGDTKGIGLYSSTFDIMPFTQGMACRAIQVLKKGEKYE